ncbi:MAG: transglutaminase domain-containing protein, partial [Candidatus Rokuibacteriota bacterium]
MAAGGVRAGAPRRGRQSPRRQGVEHAGLEPVGRLRPDLQRELATAAGVAHRRADRRHQRTAPGGDARLHAPPVRLPLGRARRRGEDHGRRRQPVRPRPRSGELLPRSVCVQFASSFTAMARAVGLPARVAVGYTPGRYDSISGVYRVTSEDAHAWGEVWLAGVGWTRFEPTPNSDLPGGTRGVARLTAPSSPATAA